MLSSIIRPFTVGEASGRPRAADHSAVARVAFERREPLGDRIKPTIINSYVVLLRDVSARKMSSRSLSLVVRSVMVSPASLIEARISAMPVWLGR